MGAMAQKSLVKEVERKAKSNPNFEVILEAITPAFSNPETANSPEPHFVAGQAGFDEYDNLFKQQMLGQEADQLEMAKALLGGYEQFLLAMPLDQLPDEKGKVKPKYTDKMAKQIGGHYSDFNNAAAGFWGGKDYAKAYDAWEVMIEMPNNPAFKKHIPQVYPDTIMQSIVSNQATAAYLSGDKEKAMEKFLTAARMCTPDKQAYDYAISTAAELQNTDKLLEICEEALPIFGDQDPMYLLQIIQANINNSNYDEVVRRIDEAIAHDPNNAKLYHTKAYIFEYEDNKAQAAELYNKAIQLDPNYGQAIFDYVRVLYNIAGELEDAAQGAEYQKVRRENEAKYKEMKDLLGRAKANVGDNDELDYKIDQVLELVKYKLGEE